MRTEVDFDADSLTARVAKASVDILKRMGAYVRRVAQSKVKTSPKASTPGTPPHSRRGLLKRAILFGLERDKKRVLIGPSFRFVGTSASAHEFGNAPEKATRYSAPLLEGSRAGRSPSARAAPRRSGRKAPRGEMSNRPESQFSPRSKSTRPNRRVQFPHHRKHPYE